MLSLQTQPKHIQKAVQLPNGSWALVTFELVEINGKLIARAVAGKLLPNIKEENEVLCLPCIKSPVEFIPVRFFTSEVLHSFLKDFSFITSQPTRAPSYN